MLQPEIPNISDSLTVFHEKSPCLANGIAVLPNRTVTSESVTSFTYHFLINIRQSAHKK